MSEFIFNLFGIATISATAAMLLKKWGADFSLLIRLMAGVALAYACFRAMMPILEYLEEFCAMEELFSYLELLIRVLCVAVLTHICATVCRDCGEGSIASYVELGGKVEILIIALPMMKNILELTRRITEA